jgi:hypothetical protein
MRTRALFLVAVLALPSVASAQIRIPRAGRRPTPPPAELPPRPGNVARAVAIQRSHWSVDGYAMVSAFQVPSPAGGVTAYTSLGTGTRGSYRVTDHVSATVDMTASMVGSPTITETAELGTRYSPMTWDHSLRPYFDLRAGFIHMYDQFGSLFDIGGQTLGHGARYSRGFGGVTGTGFEYSLTRSLALTTGVSLMRSRMTSYRIAPGSIPNGTQFWLTTFRYTLGFRFNPVRALNLSQNPRQ